jgi:hypothetical protein
MRRAAIFFDAFLDGFAMAGFMGRLRRPGAAKRLFARPLPVAVLPNELASLSALKEEPNLAVGVRAYFALRGQMVPESAIDRELREMLGRLNKSVITSANSPEAGAAHAGTR